MTNQDERFNQVISVMIALVTILAATTAFLQSYSSTKEAESDRRAQQLSLEATNEKFTGVLRASYDWQGAFQTWREVDLQALSADLAGDTAAAGRYKKLRDEVLVLSPLLAPPYFEGKTFTTPKVSQYEAELYVVDSARLTEEFAAETEVGNGWHSTSDAFVVQLSLLAVTLSLYGLSMSMKGRSRWLFIIVGSGIVFLNLMWMGYLLLISRPQINTKAIDAFAQGKGQDYQGEYEKSVQFYDQAITADPEYINAYYERANAHYSLGDYALALADYNSAFKLGKDDANIRWNMGWTYYLEGRFDEAYSINQPQIQQDPTLIGLRFNQALAMLVNDNVDGAVAEYTATLKEAERQVHEARAAGQEPSSGLWYYMDASAEDLQNLVDQLNNTPKEWTSAPQVNAVKGDRSKVTQIAEEQIKRIKESSVSLEYAGTLPDTKPDITVSDLEFGHDLYDTKTGEFLRFEKYTDFPNDTSGVTAVFEYTEGAPKKQVLWKFYANGIENRSFRDEWTPKFTLDSQVWYKYFGYENTNVFVMPAAEYTVELYIDYRLIKVGHFTIEQ